MGGHSHAEQDDCLLTRVTKISVNATRGLRTFTTYNRDESKAGTHLGDKPADRFRKNLLATNLQWVLNLAVTVFGEIWCASNQGSWCRSDERVRGCSNPFIREHCQTVLQQGICWKLCGSSPAFVFLAQRFCSISNVTLKKKV